MSGDREEKALYVGRRTLRLLDLLECPSVEHDVDESGACVLKVRYDSVKDAVGYEEWKRKTVEMFKCVYREDEIRVEDLPREKEEAV